MQISVNKLSFVGGFTIRPLLVLFMLVSSTSSTLSLSVLVCAAVGGGLEGGGYVETYLVSRAVCFIVHFSVYTGFRGIRLRRNSEPLAVLTTYHPACLSLTSPVIHVFEDGLYTATACPDDKSSSSLLSGGTTSRLCRFHLVFPPTFQVSLEGYLLLCQLQSLAA